VATIYRSYRYKLSPTAEQEATFRRFAGVCRFVYNLALEQREKMWTYYRDNGTPLNFAQQNRELTQLRNEVEWIRELPCSIKTSALIDLDNAFRSFFAGRAKYPQYRARGVNESFRFPGRGISVKTLNAKWSAVRLPKIGWVKLRCTRPLVGSLANAIITSAVDGWYVSLVLKIEREACPSPLPAVGIDRGIANSLALSDGQMFSMPDSLLRMDLKVRRAQRIMSRKVKGSQRRKVARERVARLAAARARVRLDWHHRTSRYIADHYGAVTIEDLPIVNMTARGRGKRGLNRAILNQGWGAFARILKYKLDEAGGSLVAVDPAYTSQTCSECGVIDKQSRESYGAGASEGDD